MSLRSLENAILKELREVTNLPKLKLKNITEWNTGEVAKPEPGETVIKLPILRVTVAYTQPT